MAPISASALGTLYIVATPIGNREDITFRAQHILRSVDCIFAEDTRHSLPLLTALGVNKPLKALHAHNENAQCEQVLSLLRAGKSCALISDAGTPLISDPGYPLVHLARIEEIPVVPVPGPSALITALCAAGVPTDVFTFGGFLPAKIVARRKKLTEFFELPHTLVFYESTHRIIESIEDIAVVFGECCQIVLAKELTKTFERIVSGSCTEVLSWLHSDAAYQKGEFVLIIPARAVISASDQQASQCLSILLAELPLKQAVKLAAQLTRINKNELYTLALTIVGAK